MAFSPFSCLATDNFNREVLCGNNFVMTFSRSSKLLSVQSSGSISPSSSAP
uniref:Uncharacterized protein n=1 Tax=Arundo donax TaxID=35708 RepID=A0A0A9CYT5_ARUDO